MAPYNFPEAAGIHIRLADAAWLCEEKYAEITRRSKDGRKGTAFFKFASCELNGGIQGFLQL
jgi:hypothetical protein